MKRSKRKALPRNKLGRMTEKLEHLKASVRAKVEHPFHVIKNLFRHRKTRYKGLARTPHSCSACSVWQIWSSPRGRCWTAMPEVRLECRKAIKTLLLEALHLSLSSRVAALRCIVYNSGCDVHSSASP